MIFFFPLAKVTACEDLILKQIFFLCLIFCQLGFFPLERCKCWSPLGIHFYSTVSGGQKIKTLRGDLEVHLICADKLGVVTAAFLTFPCCKRTNMQKNTVQCFGCRIDNLKCVPICMRSTLQMSESFLFTWQIVETPKKLLLSFSWNLWNLSFFFFFSYFTIYFKNISLT